MGGKGEPILTTGGEEGRKRMALGRTRLGNCDDDDCRTDEGGIASIFSRDRGAEDVVVDTFGGHIVS